MEKPITGIVLAGGKSSRMGTDKGLLMMNQKPLISYPIRLLKNYCQEILISSNSDSYEFLNLQIVTDTHPTIGPIGGLYACLNASQTEHNLFLACDMPFVDSTLIDLLLQHIDNYTVIVFSIDNFPIPVCGYYHKSILPKLKFEIENERHSLQNLLSKTTSLIIEIKDESQRNQLKNLNTLDEYYQSLERKTEAK